MLLQNKAKRLVTINSRHSTIKAGEKDDVIGVNWGKCYELLPAGDPVAVPDELCEGDYVKALIKLGDVIVTDMIETPSDSEVDDLYTLTIKELHMKAFEAGIEIPPKTKKDEIIAAIREFNAAE